jgi:hypothetical protein
MAAGDSGEAARAFFVLAGIWGHCGFVAPLWRDARGRALFVVAATQPNLFRTNEFYLVVL